MGGLINTSPQSPFISYAVRNINLYFHSSLIHVHVYCNFFSQIDQIEYQLLHLNSLYELRTEWIYQLLHLNSSYELRTQGKGMMIVRILV